MINLSSLYPLLKSIISNKMIHLFTALSCSLIFSCATGFVVSDLDDYQYVNFVSHLRVRRQDKLTFRCGNDSSSIIELYKMCDGTMDCSDESDESLACKEFSTCPKYLFTCKYGACLDKNLKCDGKKDCRDNSDETHPDCTTIMPDLSEPSPPPRDPSPPSAYPGGCQVQRPPDFGRWMLLNTSGVLNMTPLIQIPGEYVADATVILEKCDKSYSLEASEKIIFCFNGTWSRSVGRCVKTCPSLTKNTRIKIESCLKNGIPADCSNPFPETKAVIRCIPYYEDPGLDRIRFIRCNTDGDWSYQPKCSPKCGKQANARTDILLSGGKPAKKTNHPWQVALYEKSDEEQVLQCGGSLINERVVLTAAHCVTVKRRNKIEINDKDAYTVAAGKFYRTFNDDRDAEEAQFLKVLEIHIPQAYNGDAAMYGADIAILILDGSFKLTNHVLPACIDWGTKTDPTMEKPGKIGVVTGWGCATREGNASDVMKVLIVPYFRREECEMNLPPKYLEYLVYDKFCSGFIDKTTGVCKDDRGGPLVVRNQDQKFYVRGVLSVSPQCEGDCDSNEYAIYTAVSNHITFIAEYFFSSN